MPGPQDFARTAAASHQLAEVHDWLREQLALLLDAARGDGHPRSTQSDAPEGRARSLAAHCLSFCSALEGHHTREDGWMFPALEANHPELQQAVDKLRQDHHLVTELLGRIESVATSLDGAGPDDRATLRGELEGLAAILESHFRYEERVLSAALDAAD